MNEYKTVFKFADDLYAKSIEINTILEKAINSDDDLSEKVNSLYAYRLEILDNLKNYTKSDEGKKFFSIKNAKWDKVIEKIADIERKNITLMEEVMKETRMGLNNINSKKQLFVYTKGADNGNTIDIRK